MKSIKDLLDLAQARISGRSDYGPLGVAIAHLNVVVAEAKKRQLTSPTFDAVEVVLDHVHKQREALEVAGLMVFAVEARGKADLMEAKDILGKGAEMRALQTQANSLPDLIVLFKQRAVGARLHQNVPPSDADRKTSSAQ